MEKFPENLSTTNLEDKEIVNDIESQELPELTLNLLIKSESPVNLTDNKAESKIDQILAWNNYTLVCLKDSAKIDIYNEEGHRIDNFMTPLSKKEITVNWRQDKMFGDGKKYIYEDTYPWNTSDGIKISHLPLELRNPAIQTLSYNSYFSLEAASKDSYQVSNMGIFGKYIVLSSGQTTFSAFQTETDEGVVLSPKDWKRINPGQKYPQELEDYGMRVLMESDNYKLLNEQYSFLANDVGINIIKNNDTTNTPVFSELVSSVEGNVAVDPKNPNTIYYCPSSNPRFIKRLDLAGDPSAWQAASAELQKKYDRISNLQLDPSGNFFLFYSNNSLVILAKESLQEVKQVEGMTQANFDSAGHIRAIDKDGYLVIYDPNFEQLLIEVDKHKVARLAAGINLADIFNKKDSTRGKKSEEDLAYLQPLREKYANEFIVMLGEAKIFEEVQELRNGYHKLAGRLRKEGLENPEIDYIIDGLNEAIAAKEKEYASSSAQEGLQAIRTKIAAGLSLSTITEARAEMERLKAIEALFDHAVRAEFRSLALELEQRSLELFQQRGTEIITDLKGIIDRTKLDLGGFTSKSQMDDWLEFRYPQLKSKLGFLAKDVPVEADDAYRAVIGARNELQKIAGEFEEKFKVEYAKVREKASERMEATVDILARDADGLLDRLKSKGFTSRDAAEQYLSSSDARKTLEAEIMALAGDNPDIAKEMQRGLKVRLSNALTEIERGALTKVAETGQQMILFGETAFPKWEAKVKEKGERKVDLVFEENVKSYGPGIKPTEVLGDVALSVRTASGKVAKVRLYEGWEDENEWRLGLLSYHGKEISPSYVSAGDFKKIKKDYNGWSSGENSELRKEFSEKRQALAELYSERKKPGSERLPEDDAKWQEQYKAKLKEYADFAAKHNIPLLHRIDKVKAEPDIEHANGKGFVPEWQSHWVLDPQTEADLDEMAKELKMQLDLQEGIVNLKGHAGTGKDVRIKMFCSLTNRPYFGIDGTKWTTEFELSEDVMLESKDGATQTVKIPSAVLNGITTPGAVVYFNEFNAMPEQAQIFLHALMDEKRSLTLKTSSGKTVKALPSVLLVGSMNPGYAGTFEPQFATRSRMVSIEIDYPPLTRPAETGDRNPNPAYDVSEALRLARGIDSLVDLTYEANLDHNEYAQMWDKYVNKINNSSEEPNSTQKFDIDVSLALIQFAHTLRVDFVKNFEKSRDSRNALPVTQPVTGRELRRCAYALSKMTDTEKATANPEAVSRQLLERYFLSHIDKKEDQEKIRSAMNTWTSKKRVSA